MTVTDVVARPVMGLTEAQRDAAEMLQSCERVAASARANLQRQRHDLRVLEEVLPIKRAAVDQAQKDYDETRAVMREVLSLYRDLMNLTPTEVDE